VRSKPELWMKDGMSCLRQSVSGPAQVALHDAATLEDFMIKQEEEVKVKRSLTGTGQCQKQSAKGKGTIISI
jgi:hypothetical protein